MGERFNSARAQELEFRHKAAKKFLKRFRKAVDHLEKTGLSRGAALIKAGEIYDITINVGDFGGNVTSMVGRKKRA